MNLKRRDYFSAGVELLWEVDATTRQVIVFTSPIAATVLTSTGSLEGGTDLPEFSLPVHEIFAELDRQG